MAAGGWAGRGMARAVRDRDSGWEAVEVRAAGLVVGVEPAVALGPVELAVQGVAVAPACGNPARRATGEKALGRVAQAAGPARVEAARLVEVELELAELEPVVVV